MEKDLFLQPLGGFWSLETARNTRCLTNFRFDRQATNIWPYVFRFLGLYFQSNSSIFCQNANLKGCSSFQSDCFALKSFRKTTVGSTHIIMQLGIDSFCKSNPNNAGQTSHVEIELITKRTHAHLLNNNNNKGLMTWCRCLLHVGSIKTSRSSLL